MNAGADAVVGRQPYRLRDGLAVAPQLLSIEAFTDKANVRRLTSYSIMGKHYVPQEYLRGFSTDQKRTAVWMFDKVTRRWSNPAISKIAQERDYFEPEIESRLNTLVEIPGNGALSELRRGNMLDAEAVSALLNYIAVMMMRVPGKRRYALSLVPGVIDDVVEEVARELRALAPDAPHPLVDSLLAEVDRFSEKLRAEMPAQMRQQIDNPWPSERVVKGIHSMCWRLVTVPADTPLITSDNPAFYFSAYGIGSPESELTFPINPSLALLGSRRGQAGQVFLVRGKRSIAKEINRRIAVGAERFIFCDRRLPWVPVIATKTQPDLNRIVW
jgi:hypothetical protein